jgi:hypothetical protein
MNTKDLLDLYAKSHFDAFVPVERVITKADQKRAAAEYERDPAAALLENVEQSRRDLRSTQERLKTAEYDGLFDVDGFKAATKKERVRWLAAMETVKGDYLRAKSELTHWRGYVQWALDEQRAKVARLEASPPPDPRLPPERDDAEVPF